MSQNRKGDPDVDNSRWFHNHIIASLISDDMLATYRQDEEGYPFLDVWRISVTERP